MSIKNNNFGLALGTFLGSIFGSTATIFIMKKLKKLEEKQFRKEESDAIQEVTEYYEKKIKEIKDLKISGSIEEYDKFDKNVITINGNNGNTSNTNNHSRITLDKVIDEPEENHEKQQIKDIVLGNPKFIMQDDDGNNIEIDPSDYNIGTNQLETDRGIRPNRVDYSKISRNKYTGLQKEYEREELKIDVVKLPKQITKKEYDFDTRYNKVELMYYETNGIFTTMDDEVHDEYSEEYFGSDNILKFNSPEASLDGQNAFNELYLRDEELKIDYCIVYTSEDFNKVIANE